MTTVAAEQLWLDVPRPLQPRPRRPAPSQQPDQGRSQPAGQMELRIVASAPPMLLEAALPIAPADAPPLPAREHVPRPSFAEWLLGQGRRPGMVGELARAVRLDAAFPRRGGVDAVRARFAMVGADGDAFLALEEAERAFDRA